MRLKLKKALILGAGGFIGSHMVTKLKEEGFWVKGVDLKYPDFSKSKADEFLIGDLRDPEVCKDAANQKFDEVYQFAADMGGAGYIFTGENDAAITRNSALININILNACLLKNNTRIFYSSSACIYPAHNQNDPNNPNCEESSAYPANPDSEYGWEKLFSERLYLSYARNHNFDVRIARYLNVFGPEGTWDGGKEKVPAAICRKIANAQHTDSIELWGDGLQTRSFLIIDECLEGSIKLMRSNCSFPLNIGSDEMVSINQLVDIVAEIANKKITTVHIGGPLGVRGRNSHNKLIQSSIGWSPEKPLKWGLEKTYNWIQKQVLK